MQIREIARTSLISLVVLVLARWVWTLLGGEPPDGPLGYFTWAAYLVAGVVAVSVLGSIAALIWPLVDRVMRADEREREARKVSTPAHIFYVDAAGGKGPYQLGAIWLVPALGRIKVEFREAADTVPATRLEALRAIVNEASERLRREVAPDAWADALPQALAGLREHDLVLRGPSGGYHWYDPAEPR